MAEKYAGIEKYIFADVYNFFLKYKDIPNQNTYWKKCIADAEILNFKYKDHPLARCLVTSVINQLEHKICGRELNGLTHEQWEINLDIAHKIGW